MKLIDVTKAFASDEQCLAYLEKSRVTCVYGKKFPPCNHCGHHVRFVLVRAAQHIDSSENFK